MRQTTPGFFAPTVLLVGLYLTFLPRSAIGADFNPVPVIFDTDMGNDIDDVFGLGLLHAMESRGECKISAVTVSKDHPLAGPFCDVINSFYGRGSIRIGVLRTAKPSGDGPYLAKVMVPREDKSPAFPHRLKKSTDARPQ